MSFLCRVAITISLSWESLRTVAIGISSWMVLRFRKGWALKLLRCSSHNLSCFDFSLLTSFFTGSHILDQGTGMWILEASFEIPSSVKMGISYSLQAWLPNSSFSFSWLVVYNPREARCVSSHFSIQESPLITIETPPCLSWSFTH
jgi:hypothetical protein